MPAPLTEASAEHCQPHERLHLQQLLLHPEGSSTGLLTGAVRSSLEFYEIGPMLGEGSFAKVRRGVHKLTGQTVAIKTYERAKISDPQQWKRIQQVRSCVTRSAEQMIQRCTV